MRDFNDKKREKRLEWMRAAIRHYIERIKRRGEPEQPEDPHSYVTAPKKPRPNQGSAAAIVELPEK